MNSESLKSQITPITPEVTKKVLAEIAENPYRAFVAETTHIEKENPGLNVFLNKRLQGQPVARLGDYVEAGAFTHMFLRTQAESNHVSLPQVARESYIPLLTSWSNDIKPDDRADDTNKRRWEAITENEPALRAAVDEMRKYHPDNRTFTFGVIDVYSAITHAEKVNLLNRTFGSKE